MIRSYKFPFFFSDMLFSLYVSLIFITTIMLIRCSDDEHAFIIRGAGKSPRIYIKKCTLTNKERCNEFIAIVHRITGNLEYTRDDSTNLCLEYRKQHSGEEGVDWKKLRHYISNGATKEQIASIYTPQKVLGALDGQELFLYVPTIKWKHKNLVFNSNFVNLVNDPMFHRPPPTNATGDESSSKETPNPLYFREGD